MLCTLLSRGSGISFAAAILVFLAASTPCWGQSTYYWDRNGAAAGAGSTPTGTWGVSDFWNTDPTGGAGTFITNPTGLDTLVFVAGPSVSSGSSSYTITVSGSQSAAGLVFQASGATQFTGGTINIGAGGLSIPQFAFGTTASGAVTINSNLALAAAQLWTNNSTSLLTVGGAVDLGTNTLSIGGSGNTTISGVISNGALTKIGTGILTLNGSTANSYTGDTIINAGILALHLTNLATPTNLINSSILTLGGGRLNVTGKNSGTSSQSFTTTTLNSGASTISINANGGTSTTVALGAITRNTGATFNIAAPPSASLVTTTTGVNGNPLPGANAYFGAWAVYNTGTSTRYLQVSSSGTIVTGPAGSGPGTDGGSMNSPTTVYTLTASTTYNLSENRTAYGLNINGASIVVNTGASALTINGMIQTNSTGAATFNSTSGGITVGAENDLVVFITNNNNIRFNSPIGNKAGNNSNFTVSSTTTGNAGAAVLAGANTYTGLTTVNSARLTLFASNTLHSSSGIVVNGGVLDIGATSQSVNSVKVAGGAISGTTGSITSATAIDLQNGTVGGILAGAVGAVKTTPGTVLLNKAAEYIGGTTVTGGVLQLGSADVFPDSGDVLLNGGVLATGFSDTVGPLQVNDSGSRIVLGETPHSLTFAALNPTGFSSLTIDGWTGSASGGANGRIFFTDASSFTSTELDSISFTGFGPGAALIAGNELVPSAVVPEPVSLLGVAAVGGVLAGAWRRRKRRSLLRIV